MESAALQGSVVRRASKHVKLRKLDTASHEGHLVDGTHPAKQAKRLSDLGDLRDSVRIYLPRRPAAGIKFPSFSGFARLHPPHLKRKRYRYIEERYMKKAVPE